MSFNRTIKDTQYISKLAHINLDSAVRQGTTILLTFTTDDGYKFSNKNIDMSYKDIASGNYAYSLYATTNFPDDTHHKMTARVDPHDIIYLDSANIETDTPTTTTSYYLNSYDHGKVTQNYTSLTAGSVITYTLTPDNGYQVKDASVYRFNGSSLSTVDFTKGTKVKDLDIKNPSYTIVNDDLGNSLCIKVDFELIPVKHFTGTVTNYMKDSVDYSISDKDVITLTAKDGYKIKNASLEYQPYPGAGNQSIGDFTISSDNLTATINIPDDVKDDKTINLTISGDASTDLEHINPTLKADNVTVAIKGNTVTLTANDGYLIDSATLDIGNSLFGEDTPLDFTISSDKTTATVTVTDESLISADQEYNLSVKTSEKPKPKKFLQEINPTLKADNVTVKIDKNTVIVNANDGYLITGGYVGVGEVGVFSDNSSSQYSLIVTKEQISASVTIPDDKIDERRNYSLTVFTEKKPVQPTQPTTPPKYDIKNIRVADDLKDKNLNYTISDDNILTVTVKTPYIFNSLYLEMNGEVGSVTKKSDLFTLSEDKRTATLKIPEFLTGDPSSFAYIEGDIADTTPIQPVTPNSHLTQHVYQMDETGLESFVKSSMQEFSGKVENYDYTTFINQLYTLPFKIDDSFSSSVGEVVTGLFTLKTKARELKEILFNLDLGKIKVTPVNNNGFDANIESIKLYLPFVSPINIDYNDCLNKSISIKYVISFLTGQTTVNVYSNETLINSINVNIQTNLQLFSIYNNKDFGQLNTTLNSGLNNAYIKVVYYKPVENLVSYETNEHGTLKNYTGFVQTKNSNVSCGTYQEQQSITQLLNEGVIINDTTSD